MSKVLYSDLENAYSLLEYRKSHSELLIRKRSDGVNTDIIFKSVKLIFIPILLEGVQITHIDKEQQILELKTKYKFATEHGLRIYLISNSHGDTYFINAAVFGIFNNELDILETSLGDFTWTALNRLFFWYD